MELGGNNPHIVTENADLEHAVDAGIFGTFMHQGQVCISINRHLVHDDLYDEYVARFADRAASLPMGNPRDEDVVVGPIINEDQCDQILEYIEQSIEEGPASKRAGKATACSSSRRSSRT